MNELKIKKKKRTLIRKWNAVITSTIIPSILTLFLISSDLFPPPFLWFSCVCGIGLWRAWTRTPRRRTPPHRAASSRQAALFSFYPRLSNSGGGVSCDYDLVPVCSTMQVQQLQQFGGSSVFFFAHCPQCNADWSRSDFTCILRSAWIRLDYIETLHHHSFFLFIFIFLQESLVAVDAWLALEPLSPQN
jgi:hypothetical protein